MYAEDVGWVGLESLLSFHLSLPLCLHSSHSLEELYGKDFRILQGENPKEMKRAILYCHKIFSHHTHIYIACRLVDVYEDTHIQYTGAL